MSVFEVIVQHGVHRSTPVIYPPCLPLLRPGSRPTGLHTCSLPVRHYCHVTRVTSTITLRTDQLIARQVKSFTRRTSRPAPVSVVDDVQKSTVRRHCDTYVRHVLARCPTLSWSYCDNSVCCIGEDVAAPAQYAVQSMSAVPSPSSLDLVAISRDSRRQRVPPYCRVRQLLVYRPPPTAPHYNLVYSTSAHCAASQRLSVTLYVLNDVMYSLSSKLGTTTRPVRRCCCPARPTTTSSNVQDPVLLPATSL